LETKLKVGMTFIAAFNDALISATIFSTYGLRLHKTVPEKIVKKSTTEAPNYSPVSIFEGIYRLFRNGLDSRMVTALHVLSADRATLPASNNILVKFVLVKKYSASELVRPHKAFIHPILYCTLTNRKIANGIFFGEPFSLLLGI
jgi:hypothetical protein